jgi:hypothetical protein
VILKPYRRTPPRREVAIVGDDRLVTLESGRRVALHDVDRRTRIYADRDMVRAAFLHRGDGAAYAWNETPVRWLADDREVILIGSYPGTGDDFLAGLAGLRDFLASRGAGIGSMSASSWSLLRATLDDDVVCYSGPERPRIGEVVGGRQESFVDPGHVGAFESWDLSAAYASALGSLVYPGTRWIAWTGPIPDDLPAFVHARIRTPNGVLPPVPRRHRSPDANAIARRFAEREYPRDVTGTWTAQEVAAATAAGCTVDVRKVRVMLGYPLTPFAPWWDAIREARQLPGMAGGLAKVAGNALWGRLAMHGDRVLVRYVDGRPVSEPAPMFGVPYAEQPLDIAETITGRIRARLYAELMVPNHDRLIGVHTDGGLTTPGAKLDERDGWRCKARGTELVYLGPQVYRYRSAAGRITHVVSGVRPEYEAQVFTALAGYVLHLPTIGAA